MQTHKPKIINYKLQDVELNDPGLAEAKYTKSATEGISVICNTPLIWNEIYIKPVSNFLHVHLPGYRRKNGLCKRQDRIFSQ